MAETAESITKDFIARAELAKLDLNDLVKPCQRLQFSCDASDNDITIMQVNEELLQLIEAGDSVVIRGKENDSAVLCTDSKTYDIRNASTSNTLILFNDLEVDFDKTTFHSDLEENERNLLIRKNAMAWKFKYFELKPMNPRTSSIIDLLSLAPYKGPQYEEEVPDEDKFTLSDLQQIAQASDVEIIEKLTQLNSCCISGKWRLLDFGYIVECMGEILQLVESESWSCGQIPIEESCSKINDSGELVPSFVVKHLFRSYGSQFSGNHGNLFCRLDERKICRFFAEMLLKDVGRFNYSEFLAVWKESIPNGMTADEKFLKGLALVDNSSQPPAIFLFKSDDLPLDLESRFDKLFETREKWTLDDITPYVEVACMKDQSVSSVLTKFCRASTQNGVKLFSTRKLAT